MWYFNKNSTFVLAKSSQDLTGFSWNLYTRNLLFSTHNHDKIHGTFNISQIENAAYFVQFLYKYVPALVVAERKESEKK